MGFTPLQEPVHLQLLFSDTRQSLNDFENVLAFVVQLALLLHVVLEADFVPLGLLGNHLKSAVLELLDRIVEERVDLLEVAHGLGNHIADDVLRPLVDEFVQLLLLCRRQRFVFTLHSHVQVFHFARIHQLEKVVLV